MLGMIPPQTGAEIGWSTIVGILAFVTAVGLAYGFVMSYIYRRKVARKAEVRRLPEELRKAA